MDRRNFVKKKPLTFTDASLDPFGLLNRPKKEYVNSNQQKKTIIIGAGLAGLIAGFELKKAGHEFVILEAQSTCGGRIRTIREPFADGLHAEAGASRIFKSQKLIQEYSKLFQLNLVPFYPEDQNDLLDINGKNIKLKNLKKKDYQHYDERYKINISERINDAVLKIEGGMDRLPKAIANHLKENIYYGTPVIKIEQKADGVRAYYEQFNEQKFIEGDRLICTLPFSVLKHLEIEPEFSDEKTLAIFQMPYYSTCRILFQTRKRVWEEQGLNGFCAYENGELWHPTFDQNGPRGILSYYPSQYHERSLRREERINYSRKVFEKFYPKFSKYVEGHYSKFWEDDLFAQGAFSVPQVLEIPLSELSKEEGRIHFAGEHLSTLPGWMEGAIESGIRVAKEVIMSR